MGCGGCLLAPGSCIQTQYSTGYVTAGMSGVPYLRCVFVRYAIGMSLSGVSFTCALLGLFSSRCVSVRCVIPMCPCFLCHFTCHCQVCHFMSLSGVFFKMCDWCAIHVYLCQVFLSDVPFLFVLRCATYMCHCQVFKFPIYMSHCHVSL